MRVHDNCICVQHGESSHEFHVSCLFLYINTACVRITSNTGQASRLISSYSKLRSFNE